MPTPKPGDRIMGVETEFGCLVDGGLYGTPEAAVEVIKDHVFLHQRLGALDLMARDEIFEPAECGGFLVNGARLYIDAVGSHLEYATAECRDIKTLISNDRAGHRLITRAIRELGESESISVYNNSVDHFGGHTFGCHENYFVEMEEDFYAVQIPKVMAFLVTRQIFAGTGRVGGHVLVDDLVVQGPNRSNPNIVDTIWVGHAYGVVPDPSVKFQLSQRADHILKGVAGRVRFNRAMINPKWETFYSYMGRQRLHVLFGESNMMEFAYALKVGTTSLVLRLIEEGKLRDVPRLGQPVDALRSISRDPTLRWACQLWTGETTSAIEVQRRYLDLCGAFANESGETDWVLSNWSDTLDQLERDPMALADRLDWVAKKKIIEDYALSQGLELDHDTLHSIDLEYHNIDEDKGLFYALQQMGETVRVIDDLDATVAMTKPPENTRAKARAEIVRRIVDSRSRGYGIDWDGVAVSANEVYDLPNPFDTEVPTPRS